MKSAADTTRASLSKRYGISVKALKRTMPGHSLQRVDRSDVSSPGPKHLPFSFSIPGGGGGTEWVTSASLITLPLKL